MAALTHQVQVIVTQGRGKTIRVLDLVPLSLPVYYTQSIRKEAVPRRNDHLEETIRVHQLHGLVLARAISMDNHRLPGIREKGAYRDAGLRGDVHLMRAQHGERIAMLTLDDRLDRLSGKGRRHL